MNQSDRGLPVGFAWRLRLNTTKGEKPKEMTNPDGVTQRSSKNLTMLTNKKIPQTGCLRDFFHYKLMLSLVLASKYLYCVSG